MKNITIELTDTESAVLHIVAADPVEWVQNFTKERCRVAIEGITNTVVQKCLAEGIAIPQSREDMVALAIERKWVGG